MERRLHTRHRARTTVYVVMSGRKSRICKAKNLSANGVFVETENLGLRKGQQVQLAFAINLGLVTKIHRRTAIVAHVTRGGTGLMGAGKSSLVFDTLYAEGQRRYVETFSPYARQFLDRMDKPQVDRIEGI